MNSEMFHGCVCAFVFMAVFKPITGQVFIRDPPSNVTSAEGTRVAITCKAEAHPSNITYRWFKDGSDVRTIENLNRRGFTYSGKFKNCKPNIYCSAF